MLQSRSFLIVLMFFLVVSCGTNYEYKFQDPSLSFEQRVDDLVSRMTLEEKISQLNFNAPAIERLGIPRYNWWNECLHGVARAGEATVFPQAIALAASWDKNMMSDVSEVISDEARAKYYDFISRDKRGIYQGLTFWSPNINIFRDPRWGRGMETYGEDPYLTGEMAVRFIKGLQGDDPKYLKTVATSKHYVVHSGPEPLRHSFNAVTNERDFRDTYLPAFRKTVLDADVYSVMCAYNRYMGEPCCASSRLQNEILREEIGFEGYIVSDCGAVKDIYSGHNTVETKEEAAATAVINGTDLNCGSMSPHLMAAFEKDLITEQEIDIAVKRLMMARMKLGMFDPGEKVPWSDTNYKIVRSEKHIEKALDAARKSIVLLKNEGAALPLSPKIKTIAVLGPNADDEETIYANYQGTSRNPVTPLEGIRNKLGNETQILYSPGCKFAENMPLLHVIDSAFLYTGENLEEYGLNYAIYANTDFEGEPVKTGTDLTVDKYWWDVDEYEGLENDSFSVEWNGYLVAPVSGKYNLGVESNACELYLEGKKLISNRNIHHANKVYDQVDLKKGEIYHIRLRTWDLHNDLKCSLIWEIPGEDDSQKAIEYARQADQVILFMGLSPRLEGEEMKVDIEGFKGGDRTSLELPGVQKDFIRKVAATGKPVVLVLLNGSALAINWEQENIPAIVEAWYGGEQAGNAIADVLFGDYNPAGRLPVTFYKSISDLPSFGDYSMEGKTYRYFDKEVLYPFGYGLSYTDFEYGEPVLSREAITDNENLVVEIDVTNTGERDGEEVVQLYLSCNNSKIDRPVADLRGFERRMIKAGETITVEFELTPSDLEYYDTNLNKYLVEEGNYTIHIGDRFDMKSFRSADFVVKASQD